MLCSTSYRYWSGFNPKCLDICSAKQGFLHSDLVRLTWLLRSVKVSKFSGVGQNRQSQGKSESTKVQKRKADEKINKQPMGCEAQLACKCLFTTQFYRPGIWMSKVGQGNLVEDVRSGFASRSVRARLQVSVYRSYDLCHPGCPEIDAYILTPSPEK